VPPPEGGLPDWPLMVLLAVGWATVSSLATGPSTLVLAAAEAVRRDQEAAIERRVAAETERNGN
jgi:Na+(H+)/acetate symporter ActP